MANHGPRNRQPRCICPPAPTSSSRRLQEEMRISLIDLNAKLRSASVESGKRVVFEYSSDSRAIARFDRKPSHVEVDGAAYPPDSTVLLPRGDHRVTASN